MVYATSSIGILSFFVWLHHFFTMGSGANVNSFFGIMTSIISIPTGVKLFSWLSRCLAHAFAITRRRCGQSVLVQHRFCKFVAAGLRGCVGRSDEGA
jgi:heme/copper-type cytochrome/quinol oxidase subunit 1